eukprot:3954555-Prymnesium_polylepis.1
MRSRMIGCVDRCADRCAAARSGAPHPSRPPPPPRAASTSGSLARCPRRTSQATPTSIAPSHSPR